MNEIKQIINPLNLKRMDNRFETRGEQRVFVKPAGEVIDHQPKVETLETIVFEEQNRGSKAGKWMKDHKKPLIFGGLSLAAVGLGVYVYRKRKKNQLENLVEEVEEAEIVVAEENKPAKKNQK